MSARHWVVPVFLFASFAIGGCSAGFAFTQTGPDRLARDSGCRVRLITSTPGQPFTELGVLDQSGPGDIRNAGEFLRAVSAQICAAGGNGIIVRTSDTGQYMGGTVVDLH